MAFYRLLLVASLIAASGAIPQNDEILPEDNQHFNAGTLDKFNNKDTPAEQFIDKDTPAEQFIDKDTPAEQFIEESAGDQSTEGRSADYVRRYPRPIAGDMSLDQATTFWWLTQHVYTNLAGLHRLAVANKVDRHESTSLDSMGFIRVGESCQIETWEAGWTLDWRGVKKLIRSISPLGWIKSLSENSAAYAKAAVYKKVHNDGVYSADGIPIDSLVVAFAGTDFFNLPDWITNAIGVVYKRTEEGFALGYHQEVLRVQECIANRLDSVSTGATADYIVGHSQGGADAVVYYEEQDIGLYQAEGRALYADEILDSTAVVNGATGIKSRISATSQVVTFGAPKTHYDEAKDQYRCTDTVPGHRWFHAEDRVASDVSISFGSMCWWHMFYGFWSHCPRSESGLSNYKHNVENTHRFWRSAQLKAQPHPKWKWEDPLTWLNNPLSRNLDDTFGDGDLWVRADHLDNDSTGTSCMDEADKTPCDDWTFISASAIVGNSACVLKSFGESLLPYHASYDVQLGLSEGYSKGGGFTITDDGVQTTYNEDSD